jgi:hypothetical protein
VGSSDGSTAPPGTSGVGTEMHVSESLGAPVAISMVATFQRSASGRPVCVARTQYADELADTATRTPSEILYPFATSNEPSSPSRGDMFPLCSRP